MIYVAIISIHRGSQIFPVLLTKRKMIEVVTTKFPMKLSSEKNK